MATRCWLHVSVVCPWNSDNWPTIFTAARHQTWPDKSAELGIVSASTTDHNNDNDDDKRRLCCLQDVLVVSCCSSRYDVTSQLILRHSLRLTAHHAGLIIFNATLYFDLPWHSIITSRSKWSEFRKYIRTCTFMYILLWNKFNAVIIIDTSDDNTKLYIFVEQHSFKVKSISINIVSSGLMVWHHKQKRTRHVIYDVATDHVTTWRHLGPVATMQWCEGW